MQCGLVCLAPVSPGCPPTYSSWGRGQIITRGRLAAWLQPHQEPPELSPSHQLRLREINICAGIGQCQAIVPGQGWTQSVEWSEASGQHPATPVYRDLVSSSPESRQTRSHQLESSRPSFCKPSYQDAPETAQ